MKLNLPVVIVFALCASPLLNAQTRCACTYKDWQGDCSAQVSLAGDRITFEVDTQQCSRIDWYASGEPKVTIVTDGKESELWTGQATPEITVQSCKICKDRNFQTPKPKRPETAQNKLQGTSHWTGLCSGIYNNGARFKVDLTLEIANTAVSGALSYFEGEDVGTLTTEVSGTLSGNDLNYTTGYNSRHWATIPPSATVFDEDWCHANGTCADCTYYRD